MGKQLRQQLPVLRRFSAHRRRSAAWSLWNLHLVHDQQAGPPQRRRDLSGYLALRSSLGAMP